MQVQSAAAESPLTGMSIRALEIGASGLEGRRNVPATAALIGNEREGEEGMEITDDGGVMGYGGEALGAGGCGAVEGGDRAG